MTITGTHYSNLDKAMAYFNKHLFNSELPDVMLTMSRKKNCLGYHHSEKFSDMSTKVGVTEISLNPDYFMERTPEEVLSTLVHEMVHQWHYIVGEPSRKGYHNAEWASLMKEVGLYPSSTGEHGGKETGQRMSHYIIEGGDFEKVCGAFLLKHGNPLLVYSEIVTAEAKEKKKTRDKYVCPTCLTNAWAKPKTKLMCGEDEVMMIVEEEN